MSFAILRSEKIKEKSSLAKASNHNNRTSTQKNIDSKKSHLNRYEYYSDATNLIDAYDKLKLDLGFKEKKGNVLAREFICSFSPDMIGKIDLENWIKRNRQWFENRYGNESEKGKLISFEIHLDEKTPHIHATVIPAIKKIYYGEKKWCLNEKEVHGHKNMNVARKRFQAMQDDYADAMSGLGLERGLRGSTASHKTIKRYYSELNKITKDLEKIVKHKSNRTDQEMQEMQNLGLFSIKKLKDIALKYMKNYKTVLKNTTILKAHLESMKYDIRQFKHNSAMYNKIQLAAGIRGFQDIKALVVDGLTYRKEQAEKASEHALSKDHTNSVEVEIELKNGIKAPARRRSDAWETDLTI